MAKASFGYLCSSSIRLSIKLFLLILFYLLITQLFHIGMIVADSNNTKANVTFKGKMTV